MTVIGCFFNYDFEAFDSWLLRGSEIRKDRNQRFFVVNSLSPLRG